MNEIQTVKISGQGYAVDYGDGTIWYISVDGCGYDGVLAWLSEGNTPEPEFTEEELAQQELDTQIQEAKTYLASTDFKMTVDYYATLTTLKQDALVLARAEARNFLKEQGL